MGIGESCNHDALVWMVTYYCKPLYTPLAFWSHDIKDALRTTRPGVYVSGPPLNGSRDTVNAMIQSSSIVMQLIFAPRSMASFSAIMTTVWASPRRMLVPRSSATSNGLHAATQIPATTAVRVWIKVRRGCRWLKLLQYLQYYTVVNVVYLYYLPMLQVTSAQQLATTTALL